MEEDPEGGEFPAFARILFQYQYEQIPLYRSFCDRQGKSPVSIASWEQIPAVAVNAFRRADVSTASEEEARAVFLTSGTTAGERGRHLLPTLAYYHASLLPPFRAWVSPQPLTWLALLPPPDAAPHSSLSHMVGRLLPQVGDGNSRFLWKNGNLDILGAWESLAEMAVTGTPVGIFATALAWMELMENRPVGISPLRLPEGSRAVETGGFKGQRREVSRQEVYGLLEESFGLLPTACFGEYGMTELCSQLYSQGGGPFRGPPWLQVRAVDPLSGSLLPPGEVGLLRFFDLANAESMLAIQTEDRGRVDEEGRVTLLGRAPGAPPRGCSLAVDEWGSTEGGGGLS